VLSEALTFIGQVIEEFGLAQLPVKSLVDWSKEDLGSANAGIRNSCIGMLGVMHRRVACVGVDVCETLASGTCASECWGSCTGKHPRPTFPDPFLYFYCPSLLYGASSSPSSSPSPSSSSSSTFPALSSLLPAGSWVPPWPT
jgi:hypothetical protein